MTDESVWDMPIKKIPQKPSVQQKSAEKKPDQEISFLNKDNIFSQSNEFYGRLNKPTPSPQDFLSNFSCSTSSNRKNEPETNQLINLLNTLGININSTEFKPTVPEKDQNDKNITNEIVFRVKQGTYFSLYEAKNLESEPCLFVCKENNVSFFTKDGSLLVTADNYSILIYSLESKSILTKITKQNQIMNVGVSSKPNFVVSVDKIDKENFVLTILDLSTLATRYESSIQKYKKDQWPLVKFDADDKIAFKKISLDCIEILDASKNFEVLNVCLFEKFNFFYVSPNSDQISLVFTFVENAQGFDKKNSKLSIFNYNDLSKPVFLKNLEKAQEINPYFSPDGHKLLVLTQTYMDESGKSYYGETCLYHYDIEHKHMKKVPTYEGPIHDVSWNPNSEQFIVISGFMPAASVLFDKSCKPLFEFGKHHRNTIRWSPQSRFVILGGFGNLSGDIEIWDTKKFEKIGVCKSNSAVSCIWAPDGRKFLTGCLNPRLRVDNNFKVFRYDGKLLTTMNLNHTELYEVDWRPSNIVFQDFNPSPKLNDHKEEKKEEKPRKLFNPPKGTGQLSAILKAEKQTQGARVLKHDEKFDSEKFEEKNNVIAVSTVKYPPGYVPPEPKKKKKKNKKKKDKDNPNENDDNIPEEENDGK